MQLTDLTISKIIFFHLQDDSHETIKKIALLFFVTTIASAMSFGCKTGPKTKSTLDKNQKLRIKKFTDQYYYY